MSSTEPRNLKFAILASDIALFTIKDGQLLIRLVSVDRPPYFSATKGLPGGLIDPKETADEAAKRLISEKANIKIDSIYLEQLYTFSEIERDPRGRVVAVAYMAFIPWELLKLAEQEDTKEAWWCAVESAKKLAYDHDRILAAALGRIRSRLRYTTLMVKLMPKEFTLTELEAAYENILKADLDKRNFRKKLLKLKIVKGLGRKRAGGAFRPAELYSFTAANVQEIEMI